MVKTMKKVSTHSKNKNMEDFKMSKKNNLFNNLTSTEVSPVMMVHYIDIMSNRDAVQEKLLVILGSFWAKCGFDMSFIDNDGCLEHLCQLVFDEDFMRGFAEDLIEGDSQANEYMEALAENFIDVLALTTQDIKEFNEVTPIDIKEATFGQFVWLVSLFNRYNRIGLMDTLVLATKSIECEEGKQRANLLGNMLWKPLL